MVVSIEKMRERAQEASYRDLVEMIDQVEELTEFLWKESNPSQKPRNDEEEAVGVEILKAAIKSDRLKEEMVDIMLKHWTGSVSARIHQVV
jgi:hypothetical protein